MNKYSSMLAAVTLVMCAPLSWGQSIILNTTNYRQDIDMMGSDMERSSSAVQGALNTEEILQWGFGDIDFDICRVQYDKNQELVEGTNNWSFYDNQVTSMQEIKAINPDIKFFGTLRSDYDGYGDTSNLPDWFCNYSTKVIDTDKYGIFLADYVEYMSQQGVPIAYMSMAKEWQAYVPADVADDVIIKLKSELDERGIAMPLISDQGHWGLPACISYVDDVTSLGTEDLYSSFCNHNYSHEDTSQWRSLELKAAALGKSIYNDESGHGGGNPTSGVELDISIPLSAYVEKCSMYAGGVKGELFFEIWSRNKNTETRPIYFPSGGTGVRMRAYYIMKLFANNVADSTYITSDVDSMIDVHTMAFRKDDQVVLWVINEGSNSYSNVSIAPDASRISGSVAMTYWTGSTSITGSTNSYTISDNRFTASIEAESLNCYLLHVESDANNIALIGTATQSSTNFSAPASRAIDNNTLGLWDGGTITHTDTESQPWWRLDLGDSYEIDHVQIFNRTDTEGTLARLSDYDVTILGSDSNVSWTSYQSSYPDPQITLSTGGTTGQYVVIQLRGDNPLNLAEVRVFDTLPAAKGIVANWMLDDGSGSVVVDHSGNGFDATLTSGSWVTGVDGGALDFNGGSDSVSLPAEAFSSISEQISVAMWVYGDTTQPRDDSLFYAEDASGNPMLNIHLPSSNSIVYWDAGNSSGLDRINKVATSDLFMGAWNHWTFTKNASTGDMKIYVNGALWHSETGKTNTVSGITAATLGSQISSLSYDGMIDDVQLYNITLSDAEIANLYGGYEAGNYRPVAQAQSVSTAEDTAMSITLTASDADGDALTYSVQTQPAQGTLSGTAPDLTYTPDAGYNGSDSFTFTANDGRASSDAATVSIYVKSLDMYWTASSAPQSDGTLSSGLFNTNGTLVYAENTGGSEWTFDGIVFVAGTDGSSNVLGVNSPNYAKYHSGTQISSSGQYPEVANGIPTLTGLTVGEFYRVQLLFFDYRSAQEGSRIYVDDNDLGQYANGASGAGVLASLVFIADDDEFTFLIERTLSDGVTIWDQVQLNAVALHRIDTVLDPFDEWLTSYGLSGDDADPHADLEPDGLNNLMEYALGGNPVSNDASVFAPQFIIVDGHADLVYNRNTDSSLMFAVTESEDLFSAFTNEVPVFGESTETNGFKTVTNRTEVASPTKFIKLEIRQD